MSVRRSPLALAVLSLLIEQPQHPYRIQQLIKQRGKDRVVNVQQRASLYKTIDRLRRDGLIVVREVAQSAQFPERTVYEATEAGRASARTWMREMLTKPRADFPDFTAAVAHLPLLEPGEAVECLLERLESLRVELAQLTRDSERVRGRVPRLFLLEDECLRAVTEAQISWIVGVIDDLRAGRLDWDEQWFDEVSESFGYGGSAGVEAGVG